MINAVRVKEEVQSFIEGAQLKAGEEQCCFVIFIDINSMSRFNEQFGFQKGDECLEYLRAKLQGYFRRTIAYKGDAFLLATQKTDRQILKKVKRIIAEMSERGYPSLSISVIKITKEGALHLKEQTEKVIKRTQIDLETGEERVLQMEKEWFFLLEIYSRNNLVIAKKTHGNIIISQEL